MANKTITVYSRILPNDIQDCEQEEYSVERAENGDEILIICQQQSNIYTNNKPSQSSYRFKKVFGPSSTQSEIFRTVALPVINNAVLGYNGTIFAYGPTGTGKTYTMTGGVEKYEDRGLVPRAIEEIFRQVEESGMEVTVAISYFEIYNEKVYDLLPEKTTDFDFIHQQIILLEDQYGTFHLRNLTKHIANNESAALDLLYTGDVNRVVSETTSNFRSTRSHAVFTIILETKQSLVDGLYNSSKLYLVDLAGSERLFKSLTQDMIEARHINLSLHYLEQVMVALCEPGRQHVPYRNSLLTSVLKDSLGGNCITAMIATMSMCKSAIEETIHTCRFSQRVARVKTSAHINQIIQPKHQLAALRAENEKLKTQIALLTDEKVCEELTREEKKECEAATISFITENERTGTEVLPLSDLRKTQYCFELLKSEIVKMRNRRGGGDSVRENREISSRLMILYKPGESTVKRKLEQNEFDGVLKQVKVSNKDKRRSREQYEVPPVVNVRFEESEEDMTLKERPKQCSSYQDVRSDSNIPPRQHQSHTIITVSPADDNPSTNNVDSTRSTTVSLDGIPLTGDPEVDEEIIYFYKSRRKVFVKN